MIHSLGVFSWCYFLCIYAESSRRLIFGVALSHGEALLDWLIDFVIVDSKKARHVSSVHTGILRTQVQLAILLASRLGNGRSVLTLIL